MSECLTCKSLRGEISLSPGPIIYNGGYWQVEHIYPTSLKGWLVIILKRHIEALHELVQSEHDELAMIQAKLTKILHAKLDTQREYLLCFAEKEGFNHIHFHLVAISNDFPEQYRGANIFMINKEQSISEDEIRLFSQELQEDYNNYL